MAKQDTVTNAQLADILAAVQNQLNQMQSQLEALLRLVQQDGE